MKVKMSVHDKAIRLLEGGIVEIKENWFRLRRFADGYDDIPCLYCNLDSICQEEHTDVCEECEDISGVKCCLQLTNAKEYE